jgi:hypothetical protein
LRVDTIENKDADCFGKSGYLVKQLMRNPQTALAARNFLLCPGIVILLILLFAAIPLPAREKDAMPYGSGLTMSLPFPEIEVVKVVEDVTQSGIIRGTKEYNKDEYISGAVAVSSTKVFPEKAEGGDKVFYKIRLKALDPRNFKDSGDMGTLAVRYVVTRQDDKHTILRIDARFVEDFRHTVHPSNGSVESEEYKVIHDHLEELELAKAEALEVKKSNDEERQQKAQLAKPVQAKQEQSTSQQQSAVVNTPSPSSEPALVLANVPSATPGSETPPPAAVSNAQPPTEEPQTLEQRVKELRRQVERKVKAPGAPLKSAPFHSASNLKSLNPGTEVLIVVSTTYWLGVETHDGQHGWMLRDDLEPIE